MVFAFLVLQDASLVKEKWPFDRVAPSLQTIYSNYNKYRRFGSVEDRKGRGRKKTTRTPENEIKVKKFVTESPHTSLRTISKETKIPRRSVQLMLHGNGFRSFKMIPVQKIWKVHYNERIRFCKWFIRWNRNGKRCTWYSDECSFGIAPSSISNNMHYWSTNNQHKIFEIPKNSLKVHVWAAISSDGDILWEFQNGNQTAISYKELLKRKLPLMNLRKNYFQQDGASIHTANKVIKHLQKHYYRHWIGKRNREKIWPAYSPDLSPCDFYLWNRLKQGIIDKHPQNQEELKDAIKNGILDLSTEEISSSCKAVLKRCKICLREKGGHFEQFL